MYGRGDRFKTPDGDEWILAQVGYFEMTLINLVSGNRYHNFLVIDQMFNVTEAEFEQLSDGETFTKINTGFGKNNG